MNPHRPGSRANPHPCKPVMDDLLQVSEVNVMKLSAISVAIILAGAAGVAFAGGQTNVMPPINVHPAGVAACAPPNGTTGHACDGYNQFLRANFTPRQIGMLFGARTSYPEYLTGGIDRLQKRYDTLLQQYVASQRASANAASVAAK